MPDAIFYSRVTYSGIKLPEVHSIHTREMFAVLILLRAYLGLTLAAKLYADQPQAYRKINNVKSGVRGGKKLVVLYFFERTGYQVLQGIPA